MHDMRVGKIIGRTAAIRHNAHEQEFRCIVRLELVPWNTVPLLLKNRQKPCIRVREIPKWNRSVFGQYFSFYQDITKNVREFERYLND